jgi:hypothetical protein
MVGGGAYPMVVRKQKKERMRLEPQNPLKGMALLISSRLYLLKVP